MKKLITMFIGLFVLLSVVHSQQVDREMVIMEVATDATG
jgi:hypothetical protein